MILLLDYIVNAIWQIPLIAIGAAVLARFGRIGPTARHHVWAVALVLAVILPLVPVARTLGVAIAPAVTPAEVLQPPVRDVSRRDVPAVRMIHVSMAPGVAPNAGTGVLLQPAAAPPSQAHEFGFPPIIIDPFWAQAISMGWGLVLAAGLARLAIALRAAAGIARRARPADLAGEVSEALLANARRQGVEAPPVRLSDEIHSPVVVGVRTPAILVPPAFTRLEPDEQRAALLHELAHVARHDFAVNLACEALSAPICWHPVAWEIKAGVRRSREAACDAIASGALGSRDIYARRLISLAGALRLTDDGETSPALVALISKSDLEDRLMQLIKAPRAPSKLRLMVASAAAAASLAPVFLLHVTPALARDATPTVPRAHVCARTHEKPVATPASRIPATPLEPAPKPPGVEAAVAAPPEQAAFAPEPPRVVLAQAVVGPAAPSAPPPPPAHNSALPQPPAAPVPPSALDTQIDSQVREAVRTAMAEADRALASEDVRKAMDQAHVDRDAIRREVAEAMNSPEVRRALADARTAGSVEVRQALEEAKQETIRALDEAQRQADQAAARSHDEPQGRDHHDSP